MLSSQFLSWAKTANAEQRAAASASLARAFLFQPLSIQEKEEAEFVLSIMCEDKSLLVRQVLSETFAASPQTPKHLVMTLVRDCDVVAEPLIARSKALSARDLVELVMERSSVQTLIAGRFQLERAPAAALAEVGTEEACLKLIENETAEIANFSYTKLMLRFAHHPEMRHALLSRQSLPLSIRQNS